MADAALTQVANGLKTVLDDLTGVGVYVDRDESEPIQPEERPAIVIRVESVDMDDRSETGETVIDWRCQFALDCYIGSETEANITFGHNEMIAAAWALINADDNSRSLGSLAYAVTPAGITTNAEAVPDVGVAVFVLDVRFMTKFTDWTTIVFS